MTYLLCHGFGFNNNYWRNLIPLLDDEYEFFNEDFKSSSEKNYIGIGHSLGFLKLNNSGIKFRALVGLQGFLNFCGSEIERQQMLQNNLNRMMKQCEQNPQRFLKFFHKLCGNSDESLIGDCSEKYLLQDLELMKHSYVHCQVPTLIIGSLQDKIVENVILEDNFKNQDVIQLRYINGVNHTLGFAKPHETFEQINAFLKEFVLCKKN